MLRAFLLISLLITLASVAVLGFRGEKTTNEPWELFPDMVRQMKVRAQSPLKFFADGRGPRPSAKNCKGDCARTFICRTMSGKSSHGSLVVFSPRNPSTATLASVIKREIKRKARSISVLVHDGDVLASGALK